MNLRRSYLPRQPPGLKFVGDLRDDIPSLRLRRAYQSGGQGAFDRRLPLVARRRFHRLSTWPKRDQLPRTYVNSRRVVRT